MKTRAEPSAKGEATRALPKRAAASTTRAHVPAWRAQLEPAFGADFSRVRLHTDASADRAARAFDARAFTRGADIYFASGEFRPETADGLALLAHELSHVMQQRGPTPVGTRTSAHALSDAAAEREADGAARDVLAGRAPRVSRRPESIARQGGAKKPPRNIVVYSGGYSGSIYVIKDGAVTYMGRAVSGHTGSSEWEKGVGPIPTGSYALHPKQTAATVTKPQGGVCSASAISSGFQEITSDEPQKCEKASHYCTIDCAAQFGTGATCYTPKSCWGARRMKIEGSARVAKPGGGTVTRSGFYIHGGDHSVAMTSGCIKVFDDTVFDRIRELPGAVPLCVGSACPEWAVQAANLAVVESAVQALREMIESVTP
ncbi:MAG TPA: DUF4157 domain-containing protein [Burkholderiaceae bacterium]|nr:DUF4157 domain-containing protein [Burkholderiaceae bacterium]